MELFNAVRESMNDPQRWHAVTVHLPIVMGLLGVLLLAALVTLMMIARAEQATSVLRWVTVAFYVAAATSAIVAERSGHDAADSSLADVLLTDDAQSALDAHREMAERAWLFFAGVAAVTAATALGKKHRLLQAGLGSVALTAAVATMGWISITAHHGGELVYEHGVGVPATENNLPAPATQPDDTEKVGAMQENSPAPSAPEGEHKSP